MIKTQHDVQFYELEITQDCNAECPLCERTEAGMPLRGNPTMTLDDIKKIFPTKDLIKGRNIGLCGTRGDPILNPQCYEICKYLHDNEVGFVTMSTNGGYNNVEWWKKLATLDNIDVDFCFDGHEKTNHIYRVNVNWNTAIRNLEAYVEAGGYAKWVFIAFEHNEIEFEKCKAHAEKLGIEFQVKQSGRNYRYLNNVKAQNHKPKKHDTTVALKTSEKITDFRKENVIKATNAYVNKNLEKQKQAASTIVCRHFNDKHLYISATLEVSPCCYMNATFNRLKFVKSIDPGNLKFANLNNISMQEILDKFNEIDIKKRWNPEDKFHMKKCVTQCGNKGAMMDKRKILIERK